MSNINKEYVICRHCGNKLGSLKEDCSFCGGKEKTLILELYDEVKILDAVEGKVVNPSFNKKRRDREIFFDGYDRSINGQYVYKKRIINKEKNHYYEIVRDNNGSIIRECDELLTDHKGRGSAKNKGI